MPNQGRFTTETVSKKFYELIKKNRKVFMNQLEDVAILWSEDAANIVRDTGHVDRYRLYNDIDVRPFSSNEGVGLVGMLPSTSEYGIVIHEGRRPGARMQPYGTEKDPMDWQHSPIAEWMQHKLGMNIEDDKFYAIFRAIRRNIGLYGFKSIPAGGLQFFARPLAEKRRAWLKQIRDGFMKELKKK